MANQEEQKRSIEGEPTDGSPESEFNANHGQENDPNAEVERQIDTGEENAA